MSKRKGQKQSVSQRVLWLLSVIIVGSMVVSLVIVALPSAPAAEPTALPTWTPVPPPSQTPTAQPTESLLQPSLTASPSAVPTEPAIGPSMATDTPTAPPTATQRPSPTVTPTVTRTAAASDLPAFTVTPTGTIAPSLTGTPGAAIEPDFTFAVAGDSRSNPEVYARVLAAIEADGVGFMIHTGDLVDQGTEAQWQAFEPTMAGFALPFYPVPGNHDGLKGQLDGYLAHSGAPAAHYSFDRGSVHFSFADSHDGGIRASELEWLRQDLSATSQPVKIVVVHHPPFDPDGGDHIMAFGNEPFMALMVEQQVDHVLTGHIHAYVQGKRDNVLYTITGGGGAELHAPDHPQAFYHYLRVTVRGETVSIEVVKV